MPTRPRRDQRAAAGTQLQDELQHAAPAEKPGLLNLIKGVDRQLVGLQKQLAELHCRQSFLAAD
jgi:hypothetical protein